MDTQLLLIQQIQMDASKKFKHDKKFLDQMTKHFMQLCLWKQLRLEATVNLIWNLKIQVANDDQ